MNICFWLAPAIISTSVFAADQQSTIARGTFQGSQGNAAINQAAGDHNLQANGHAIGNTVSIQNQQETYMALTPDHGNTSSSRIESQAFAGFEGLLSVNQVSGTGNIQANLGTVAFTSLNHFSLSDNALTEVAGSGSAPTPTVQDGQHKSDIAQDSFSGVQGAAQINQISGDQNIAINQFSLQFPNGK